MTNEADVSGETEPAGAGRPTESPQKIEIKTACTCASCKHKVPFLYFCALNDVSISRLSICVMYEKEKPQELQGGIPDDVADPFTPSKPR